MSPIKGLENVFVHFRSIIFADVSVSQLYSGLYTTYIVLLLANGWYSTGSGAAANVSGAAVVACFTYG